MARQAELAAAMDAALQDPARQDSLGETVIRPAGGDAQQAARDTVAAKAAATRVAFFTHGDHAVMMLDRPGFADPAVEAQACFRAVLDAMSRPGTVHPAGAGLTPPDVLDPATASLLLTLADGDTPVWLDPAFAAAWDWIAFHCGAVRATSAGSAVFACARDMPALDCLHPGSDLAPEDSATLVLQVRAFGQGTPWHLSGPGLREPSVLCVDGLPGDFTAQWAANHALYPRGIDMVLCAGAELCALPRTLHVQGG